MKSTEALIFWVGWFFVIPHAPGTQWPDAVSHTYITRSACGAALRAQEPSAGWPTYMYPHCYKEGQP